MKKLISAVLLLTVFVSQPAKSKVDTRKLATRDGYMAAYVFAPQKDKPSYVELRLHTGRWQHTLQHSVPGGLISSVEFSRDGSLIVIGISAAYNPRVNEPAPKIFGQVRLYYTSNGELLHEITEPKASIRVATFSPDAKTVAIGSGDGRIQFWDVSSGKISRTIFTRQHITSLDFSPNGDKLASTLSDDKIRIWNVGDGKIWKVLDSKDDSDTIAKASFSPDGRIITSGGYTGPVQRWNVRTGRVLQR